ncbi:helix-turn-helix domain-containing protein [Flammeovirga aprica]|uniref:Helix-turn-helix domain-containing protein n=1 Tax=Flammeovirga aprica JL-4 TaxID=694437 RepID=A0A7X9RT81_9BACT|nr:helix-turn-helix domain-containing protein [Flammeovirga aprica]NME68160.1 helix-turn-helix domain-containing protein [Flammeovirga aprica JL-4]
MKNLTLADRKYIEFALQMNRSKTTIARKLGVAPSTIYREIKRNSKRSKYIATYAQQLAIARKKLTGGLSKKKKYFRKYKRRNPYRLYADRRQIFWCSDSPLVYSNYFKTPSLHLKLKKKRYQKRLNNKKKFHFRNDLSLFLLFKAHKEKYTQDQHTSKSNPIEIIFKAVRHIA